MSLLEEILKLNEGLDPEDLLRLPENEGIARQNARLEALRTPDSQEITPPARKLFSGKGSWYSQLPQHGWVDREDKPGSNALGVPDENQGIALPSRKTLGQWFDVTFPDGQVHRLQQTDVGPAQWTGKGIDISAAAAHKAGFKPDNFPTGGGFTWSPAEGPGGSGNPPEETAATFDPTGRKRMANGDSQGILGALGMQNQQPQGLLGALGDPETMAYIGMMLKGMNPYSQIDPNAMLASAHTNALRKEALRQQLAEQARDNARADERLGFDRERFNLTKSEHEAQQAERKAQQERDRQALDRLAGGGSSTFTPDPAAVTDPATAEATTRRVQLEKRLESLNREWPQVSEKLRPQLRMEIERTEKALGMSASESRTYTEAKEAKSGAETAKLQVDRAVDILQDPNLYEGLKKRGSEFVGGIIGESSLPDTARKTNELSRIMTTEGLQELAKHLKPLSEREGMLITSLMNNPGMALSEKKRRMEELQQELNKRVQRSSDTISDLEERERAGTAARRRGDSGNATRDALKSKYGLE